MAKGKTSEIQDEVPDPRQTLFISYYLDPTSSTFSNAYQSAVRANYTNSYALKITELAPKWLVERVEASSMLSKALRNLNRYLEMKTEVRAMGAFGPLFEKVKVKVKVKMKNGKFRERSVEKKIPILVTNAKLLAIQQDTSKFVAERIGKAIWGKDADAPSLTQNNIYVINGKQRARVARRIIARLASGEGTLGGLRDSDESEVRT